METVKAGQETLTSSPLSPLPLNTLIDGMYRLGVVVCIIMAVITIIGVIRHKEDITIRAIIGFVTSIIYTIVFYNKL